MSELICVKQIEGTLSCPSMYQYRLRETEFCVGLREDELGIRLFRLPFRYVKAEFYNGNWLYYLDQASVPLYENEIMIVKQELDILTEITKNIIPDLKERGLYPC